MVKAQVELRYCDNFMERAEVVRAAGNRSGDANLSLALVGGYVRMVGCVYG